MIATRSCPAVHDLQRLARADIDGAVAGVLRRHLDECERCAEIVQLLETEAGGADAQTAGPTNGSGTWRGGLQPAGGPTPAHAVRTPAPSRPARGSGLKPVIAAAPASPSKPLQTSDVQEVLALLGPPQSADELGRLGCYRVFRVLGSGATGVVFLAEDVGLRRQVALKVMKPVKEGDDVARQRFLREAQAAAVIENEHIVAIYQVGEEAGVPYLAMKLLEGETLDDRLKREGQLLVHDVLRIGLQVASGLAAAHAHGLIHRDIKPANIFLEAIGDRVKIVDFGLARAASDDQHLTRTGTIVGTPAYMSPEQARGLRIDQRSDLFSLGCLLYRMCAGRPPFIADDTLGMLTALSQDHPPPVKAFNGAVPDLLAGLITQMLAKLPEGRPQSAESVAGQLKAMSELVAAAGNDPAQIWAQRDPTTPRSLLMKLVLMVALASLGWAVFTWGPAAYHAVSHNVPTFRLK